MKIISLFILSVTFAWAACTEQSAGVWRCASGTSGADVQIFLAAKSYACGDTILFDTGANYAGNFTLPAQTNCTRNKYTTITSTGARALAPHRRVEKSDDAYMTVLETANTYPVITFGKGANNWRITGVVVRTAEAHRDAKTYASLLFSTATVFGTCIKINTITVYDGFSCGAGSLTQISVSSGLATAVQNTGGLNQFSVGQVVRVNYATEISLNGRYTITGASYPNLTFAAPGVPDGTYNNDNLTIQEEFVSTAVYPHDILVDRVIAYPWEAKYLPNPYGAEGDTRALLTSLEMIWGVDGYNITLRDNNWYGNIGYYPTDSDYFGHYYTLDTISSASPAIITSTGLGTALGGVGYWHKVVFYGATGEWLDLNRERWVKVTGADTLEIRGFDYLVDYDPATTNPSNYDASGKAAFSGTVAMKRVIATQHYQVLITSGLHNYQVINNSFEGWGMLLFLGGGGAPSLYTANILAGATSTSAALTSVEGLSVGDYIALSRDPDNDPQYEECAGKGCASATARNALVTGIDGNLVTYEAAGINGIKVAPWVGGKATWNGERLRYGQFRRNRLERKAGTNSWLTGKGAVEVKQGESTLIDGNYVTGVPSQLFVTVRNQGGWTPWMNVNNTQFSNNLLINASSRWLVGSVDDEFTTGPSTNAGFLNNLGVDGLNNQYGGVTYMLEGSGFNGFHRHNTLTPAASGSNVMLSIQTTCTVATLYGAKVNWAMQDNIVAYGNGVLIEDTDCWPTRFADLVSNILVDTQNKTEAVIEVAWPNNVAVADYATVQFKGTCDKTGENWKNCALAAESPYKGTASDGKDPGADVQQIDDHLNGWSEDAGLIEFVPGVGRRNRAAAFLLGSTRAAIRYRAETSTCTIKIYTDASRETLHADSDTGGEQACGRAGNPAGWLVLGSTALTTATTYYYAISDGAKLMTGEFATRAAGSGGTILYRWPTARSLSTSASADMSNPTTQGSATTHTVAYSSGITYMQSGSDPVRAVAMP